MLSVADKVTPVFDASLQRFTAGIAGTHQVTIRMQDGTRYFHQTDRPYGRNPDGVTQADLEAKLRDCATFAAKPPTPARVDAAIAVLRDLERCPDVGGLVASLS